MKINFKITPFLTSFSDTVSLLQSSFLPDHFPPPSSGGGRWEMVCCITPSSSHLTPATVGGLF